MAKERPLLEFVSEGMKVIDGAGDDIGKVDLVRFADSGSTSFVGTGTVAGVLIGERYDATAVGNPGLPDGLYERYRQRGFFHVDGKGWIDTDRWVTADQIASVSNGVVHLNVAKEALLEA